LRATLPPPIAPHAPLSLTIYIYMVYISGATRVSGPKLLVYEASLRHHILEA
jgi:hypothetical protein